MLENTKDLYGKMTENLMKSNKKLMDEIKPLVMSELREIKTDIGMLRNEVQKTVNKVQDME